MVIAIGIDTFIIFVILCQTGILLVVQRMVLLFFKILSDVSIWTWILNIEKKSDQGIMEGEGLRRDEEHLAKESAISFP